MNNINSLNKLDSHKYSVLFYLPSIFFISVIVLIVRLKVLDNDLLEQYWSNNSHVNDYFFFYKMVGIVICASIAIAFGIYLIKKKMIFIEFKIIYVFMAIYVIFTVLSCIFSEYKMISFWGISNKDEGTLVIICYMILLVYIINTVNSSKAVKLIIFTFLLTCTYICIVGALKTAGIDIYALDIIQKIITPNYIMEDGQFSWDAIDNVSDDSVIESFLYYFTKPVYATLGFAEFIAQYLSLAIPIIGFIFIGEKKIKFKILWGMLFALFFYVSISTHSANVLIALVFGGVIALIVFRKQLWKWKASLLCLLIITICIGCIFNDVLDPDIKSLLKKIIPVSYSKERNNSKEEKHSDRNYQFDYLETNDLTIYFSINGNEGQIDLGEEELEFTDKNNKIIPQSVIENEIITLSDERYKALNVKKENENITLRLDGDDYLWNFIIKHDNVYYINEFGKAVTLDKVQSWGFENHMNFGSGRGYIWSRTIPLLNENIIIGNGLNTSVFYLPDDYVSKHNLFGSNVIFSHTHNFILEGIMDQGVIAMCSWLAMILTYLVSSIRLFRIENKIGFLFYFSAGIFVGICSSLVSMQMNVSSVSYMPAFYGLLGTGIALNAIIQNYNKRNSTHSLQDT